MPNIIRFSKAQQGQLKLAKEAGVDTECLFHPEWGPVLMNTCWNRESRNESTFPIHKAAAYLSEYFPMKDGVLFDEPLTIFYAVKMFKHGATPMAPPKKTDGTPDMPMFTFIRKRDELLAGGAYRLYSGRVSINDVHWLDMPDILAEGIPDALHIIHALQARAVITTRPDGSRYEMPAGDKRQMALLNIQLCLDDMNIRGYQIPYAMEYAGGSIETLFGLLHGERSEELCRYINMKSAQDYLAGNKDRCQIAVSSGASFCHDGALSVLAHMPLTMSEKVARRFAEANIAPLAPDWAQMDIIGRIDMNQAMKIMEARGFHLIRRIDRRDMFEPDETVSDILFYHPDTHDYVQASTCLDQDVCYGGVHLYMHRQPSAADMWRTFNWPCSSRPHREQPGMYFEFSHHDGLFRAFDGSLRLMPEQDFDWAKIGFDSNGIPIPVYFKMPAVSRNVLWERLGGATAHVMDKMGSYYFESLVNHILALYDDALLQSASPHYHLYADWVDNGGLLHAAGWLAGEEPRAQVICNAVFTWLRAPKDVIESYMVAGPAYMNSPEDQDAYQKLKKKLSGNDPVGRKIAEAYELPDPRELPVKLPWLS